MGLIHHALLNARDIHQDLKDLPQTLTSWDKCMEKSFCKWPVIAGCIIGGIIVISCVWCIIRCCMCGVACCSCCCGGCGGSKTKTQRVEYVAAPPIFAQPAYQPPPAYENQKTGVVHSQREMPRAYPSQAPREQPREAPQYAYENQGSVSDNALPAMPTWESMKVEVVKEEVEMNHVNNEPHRQRASPGPGPGGYAAPSGASVPRGTSPGPSIMSAPVPVNPAGQKLGFNPRGQTPAPAPQYDERGVDQYGYPLAQQPMPSQQQRYNEFDSSYPYNQGHATVPSSGYFQDERDFPGQAGYGAPQNNSYQQDNSYTNDQHHTGYPREQNAGYPLDQQNSGYPLDQQNSGYPLDQHNTGYPLDQHNTGYAQNQAYNRPQSLDYPADIASAPAQTGYPAQNQQAELGLPTRSLTSPTNGGYAAYNAPQEPSGYAAFPGASSTQSSKLPQGNGYGNTPASSNSNGGYQAYVPSQQQPQALYPDEDNYHGAYDDKRRKQQEWSAL